MRVAASSRSRRGLAAGHAVRPEPLIGSISDISNSGCRIQDPSVAYINPAANRWLELGQANPHPRGGSAELRPFQPVPRGRCDPEGNLGSDPCSESSAGPASMQCRA